MRMMNTNTNTRSLRMTHEYIESGKPMPEASLHPPIHSYDDQDTPLPGSVLLDYIAYLDESTNGSTACSETRDGHRIRVTFWPAHPPRISCFTVWCPDLNSGEEFAEEPVIVAVEGDVVLLRAVLGSQLTVPDRASYDYFVYLVRARKLERIKQPAGIFSDGQVGILHDGQVGFYIIAALVRKMMAGMHYDLHTYDSRTGEWATRAASLMLPPEQDYHRLTTKVIVLGGKAGTVGWVNLWRGILFCDLLLFPQSLVQLRHVALPPPISPIQDFQGCPRIARDIALVNGRITYVELQSDIRPGSVVDGNFIADDWTVATWFMIKGSSSWRPSYRVSASQIPPENNFELLHDQGRLQPTLQRLHTAHPTLCLHDHNVVYLMTKVNYLMDTNGRALAVDVRNKVLRGVAQFDAQRTIGVTLPFICCGISQHLQL